MRKWMSERLKRRKKPGDGSNKDSSAKEITKAPEPLQPRFYDNEQSEPARLAVEAPVVEAKVIEAPARRPSRAEPEPTSEPMAEPTAAAALDSKPRASRRRRTRGGRGRSRPKAEDAVPRAAETSGAEGSAPESAPAETAIAEPVAIETLPKAVAPRQTVPAAVRPCKGTVVLAIGLPGSGKSSWFKRHSIHPLSSDLLRELLFDDAQEQRFQDLVFSNLRSMLKARLIARRPMNYVDATNLTPHDRSSWIKLAKDYGYDVQGVFFDVPLEVCMERHQRRGRAVPEDVMRKMAGKLKAPTFEEGFSKITVVRVKQKEEGAG